MNLTLTIADQKLIEEKVRAGEYDSAEHVIHAALASLRQQGADFGTGSIDQLLAEGEASIDEQGTLDGDDAFANRHVRRQSVKGSPG